jgi:hypothetical protein
MSSDVLHKDFDTSIFDHLFSIAIPRSAVRAQYEGLLSTFASDFKLCSVLTILERALTYQFVQHSYPKIRNKSSTMSMLAIYIWC